jgi:hypothetical protein
MVRRASMIDFGSKPENKDKDQPHPSSIRFNGPSKSKMFQSVEDIETEQALVEKDRKVKMREDADDEFQRELEERRSKRIVTNGRPSIESTPTVSIVTNKPGEALMDKIHREQREDRQRLNDLNANRGTPYAPVSKPVDQFNPNAKREKVGDNKPFHTEADTKAENMLSIMLKTYPQFSGKDQIIKNIFKQLIDKDLSIVTSWGEDQIIEQRNLVSTASDRIREFNALNGSALLSEVLEFSKESNTNQGSFFKRLTSKFSGNSETYNTRVTALRVQVNNLFPILRHMSEQCKRSDLALYLAILSTVDDETKDKDKLLADAYYNRRMLLNGALKNMQMLGAQLEQTLELVTNTLNEISHIMDVILPALKMKG